MKYIKTKIKYLSLLILIPFVTLAQTITISNPIKAKNLMELINDILSKILLPIGAVVVVISIIYAGFTFVTAQGKPAEIEKAKTRLLWTLIGAAILLGAVGISEVVKNTIEKITG
jgi:hypothetical protein